METGIETETEAGTGTGNATETGIVIGTERDTGGMTTETGGTEMTDAWITGKFPSANPCIHFLYQQRRLARLMFAFKPSVARIPDRVVAAE